MLNSNDARGRSPLAVYAQTKQQYNNNHSFQKGNNSKLLENMFQITKSINNNRQFLVSNSLFQC
jgi:hypothetical protein